MVLFFHFLEVKGQDISLYQQFNGHYDFTFIGNTMNTAENNSINQPVTITSSAADLNLNADATVVKAYLYWAGCGDGDFSVKLNTTTMTPDRTFSYVRDFDGVVYTYFSAFKDITNFIQTNGNGSYTLSELDVTPYVPLHLQRRTNFAGWAILLVYSRPDLPLNQINIYDGLEGVPDDLTITLNDLNVIDNQNSKVGFLAWEGDSILATEEFRINGDLLFNAQNPYNNVFNSTNSITGSTTLYNMDLDIYNIQNNIQIGDNKAEITLSSSQDFVMINTVVTKFNSQVPDGTIVINEVQKQCNSRTITIDYTLSNLDCTGPLPPNTPVTIYANNSALTTFEIGVAIPIDGTLSGQITVTIPDTIPNDFNLTIVVDDKGDGTGTVVELEENNNVFNITVTLISSPPFNLLPTLIACNEGFTQGTFNFSAYADWVKVNSDDTVAFYENSEDAEYAVNPILNTTNYLANVTPKEIFVRINNENCYSITSFLLTTRNCPPTVYNYISANVDGYNDVFTIDGLDNIFLNYRIEIYNRWGKLIWTGNPNTEKWNGTAQNGISSDQVPDGTYFYLLFLNDPDYPKPLSGYVFLVR
ncbi:gliding motility-associated C-terminal domain-containing protein [Flavobacterium cheonhonense]|uniref:gliding motility-associated C-terminal domain-containing protein n=1 Tax=Flavobacterium cheonhonense TaxID=706185 RepID=UPI002D79BA8F|nr:gliding motility-associated C-terminal domain-containing protein [Flavobacterium cheonhonense]